MFSWEIRFIYQSSIFTSTCSMFSVQTAQLVKLYVQNKNGDSVESVKIIGIKAY